MKKKPDDLHKEMRGMVIAEFLSTMKAGVIVVTVDEMTNIFINLLKEFIDFQKIKKKKV